MFETMYYKKNINSITCSSKCSKCRKNLDYCNQNVYVRKTKFLVFSKNYHLVCVNNDQ